MVELRLTAVERVVRSESSFPSSHDDIAVGTRSVHSIEVYAVC